MARDRPLNILLLATLAYLRDRPAPCLATAGAAVEQDRTLVGAATWSMSDMCNVTVNGVKSIQPRPAAPRGGLCGRGSREGLTRGAHERGSHGRVIRAER